MTPAGSSVGSDLAQNPLLSPAAKKAINRLVAQYPEKVAALLPVLHLVQKEFGYLSPAVIDLVAKELQTTAAHVYGTAQFYDMYRFEARAKHEILICRNISCYLNGCDSLKAKLTSKFKIEANGRSKDNRFALIEVECLAQCDKAPVIMVDEKLYERVDGEKLPPPIAKLLEER